MSTSAKKYNYTFIKTSYRLFLKTSKAPSRSKFEHELSRYINSKGEQKQTWKTIQSFFFVCQMKLQLARIHMDEEKHKTFLTHLLHIKDLIIEDYKQQNPDYEDEIIKPSTKETRIVEIKVKRKVKDEESKNASTKEDSTIVKFKIAATGSNGETEIQIDDKAIELEKEVLFNEKE